LRLLPPYQQFAAQELRLFDPQTGTRLLSYQEAEFARQEAELARQEAEQREIVERQRAEQAEHTLNELLERLRSQGIDPQQL
jgi:hypothetical protein